MLLCAGGGGKPLWKLPSCSATAEETAEEVVTDMGLNKALKRLEVMAPHVLEPLLKT